jgi:Protein of unknown function (DUF2585)
VAAGRRSDGMAPAKRRRLMSRKLLLFTLALLLTAQASTLYFFGQPPICTCGYVKVWEGNVLSSENSQHLTDWYTFSHIIHGFIFYGILWALFPRMSVLHRLVLALGVEVAWEIIENTPMVIQHYREQALAQGYTGDSIINSVSDSLAMVAGFLLAWRLPLIATFAVPLALEAFVAYEIRDNLTLNIINLIHTFPAIHNWQSGLLRSR